MIFNPLNPWGATDSTFDIQRTDLYTLDLRQIVALIQNPSGVSPTSEYTDFQLLASSDPEIFTQKIILPETTIDALAVIQGTQWRNMPAYDAPLTSTRIDFIQDIPIPDPTDPAANDERSASAIYALLQCWFMLGMAGQQRFNRVPLPLLSAESKPSFKGNLTLTLLQGNTSNLTAGDLNADPVVNSLEDSATYNLNGCWLSDLQYPDLDHGKNGIAMLTATLQIGSITIG